MFRHQSVSFHARLCSQPTTSAVNDATGEEASVIRCWGNHIRKKMGFNTASDLLYFIFPFWERYICMYQFFIGNTSYSLRRYLTTLFSNDSASLYKPMPTQYRVTLAPLRKPYRIGLLCRHTNGNFRPISVTEAGPRWSWKEVFTGRIGFWAHFSWHREQEVFIAGQSIFHVNMICYPV